MSALFLDILPTIIEWDKWLLHKINTEWTTDGLDWFFPRWRSRETWLWLYPVLILWIIYKYRMKGVYMVLGLILTVVASDLVSSSGVKEFFQRVRPCHDALVQIRQLTRCSNGFSFTSSHACNHFALSTALILIVPMFRTTLWKAVWLLWAASIAYGQVYIAVHYPTDVLAGSLLGVSIAWGMFYLYSFLQRKFIIPTA